MGLRATGVLSGLTSTCQIRNSGKSVTDASVGWRAARTFQEDPNCIENDFNLRVFIAISGGIVHKNYS